MATGAPGFPRLSAYSSASESARNQPQLGLPFPAPAHPTVNRPTPVETPIPQPCRLVQIGQAVRFATNSAKLDTSAMKAVAAIAHEFKTDHANHAGARTLPRGSCLCEDADQLKATLPW